MPAEICGRCQVVEECYEFMLAYAAQGLASETSNQSGTQIREVLQPCCGRPLGACRRLCDRGEGLMRLTQRRSTSRSWTCSSAMRTTRYAPSSWWWRNQQSARS